MSFSKFFAVNSEFHSAIFGSAKGALFAVNGRLSGFYPNPIPSGDPTTPGISSTGLVGGSTVRAITVDLFAPRPGDDFRFSPDGQRTSCAIVNGVVLKSDAAVSISETIIEAPGVTLVDQNPLTIFVTYGRESEPIFGIKRESVIDASPQLIAKLAFYDPETQTWLPSPAVSLHGIYQRLLDIATRLGGFLVTRDSLTTLRVAPGFIVGQFGRVINPTIRLLTPPAAPGTWRKDVLFVNDPGAENLPITFTMLSGAEVGSLLLAKTAPPSRPTAPNMIPLAEIIQDVLGVVEVIDVRPVQSWQTDSMQAHDPDAVETVNITSLQPGLALKDLIPGADQTWEVLVMRGKDPVLGSANRSKLVVGLTGPVVERSFAAPPAGSLMFVPGAGQFPFSPYVIQSSFKVTSITTSADVTNDPAYAINFDFMNGRFVPDGITAQSFNELFRVSYRQLQVLFTFGDDGAVSIPELSLIIKHIAANRPYWDINPITEPILEAKLNGPYTSLAQNPAAHTGSNIVFDNKDLVLPGGTIAEKVSTQKAIEILLANPRPPPLPVLLGKKFSVFWRSSDESIPIETKTGGAGGGVTFIAGVAIIGPSGGSVTYDKDEIPFPPFASTENGFVFPFPSAKIISVSISMLGYVTIPAGGASGTIGNDAKFSIFSGDSEFKIPGPSAPGTFVWTGGGAVGGLLGPRPRVSIYGSSTVSSAQIFAGQVLRIGIYPPGATVTISGPTGYHASMKIDSFSADIVMEIT